jgi:hypothetical protein
VFGIWPDTEHKSFITGIAGIGGSMQVRKTLKKTDIAGIADI